MGRVALGFHSLVPLSEFVVFGSSGVAEEEDAGGFQDAMDFRQKLRDVVEMMGSSSAGYEIDRFVRVRDVVGFDDFEAYVVDLAVIGDLPGLVEHSFGEVGGDDRVAELGDGKRRKTGPGCDVERQMVPAHGRQLGYDPQAVARRVRNADGVICRLAVELFLSVCGFRTHDR